MSLDDEGLECLFDEVTHKLVKGLTPIDVATWMELHYGKEWEKVKTEQTPAEIKEEVENNIRVMEDIGFMQVNSSLLTVEECQQIFPAMYKEALKKKETASDKG